LALKSAPDSPAPASPIKNEIAVAKTIIRTGGVSGDRLEGALSYAVESGSITADEVEAVRSIVAAFGTPSNKPAAQVSATVTKTTNAFVPAIQTEAPQEAENTQPSEPAEPTNLQNRVAALLSSEPRTSQVSFLRADTHISKQVLAEALNIKNPSAALDFWAVGKDKSLQKLGSVNPAADATQPDSATVTLPATLQNGTYKVLAIPSSVTAPTPTDVAGSAVVNVNGSGTDPSDTTQSPAKALAGAGYSFGSDLGLITSTIYVGQLPTFNGYMGLSLTSSVATSKNPTSTSTTYSASEMLIPDGGLINFHLSLSPSMFGWKPSASGVAQDTANDTKGPFGDRGQVADRWYPRGSRIDDNGFMEIDEDRMLFYVRNGFGAKALSRSQDQAIAAGNSNSASSTPTTGNGASTGGSGTTPATTSTSSSASNLSNYGVAASAYFGAGVDSGIFDLGNTGFGSIKGAITDPKSVSGTLRLEALVSGTWADHASVEALYPSATHLHDYFFGYGGRFSLIIGTNINAAVQFMEPMGPNRKATGKSVLGSVTINR